MNRNDTYFISKFYAGWNGSDACADGEFNSVFSSNNAWLVTQSQREWFAPQACIMSRMSLRVSTNNNTSDGANFRFRHEETDGNQIVTVDQATGEFQDLTNTDTFANMDRQGWEYNQSDAGVTIRSVAQVIQLID